MSSFSVPLLLYPVFHCNVDFLYHLNVGIGVPLVLMTIGKVALYDQVGLLMFQRRKMPVGQILREVAPVTSL